MSDTYFGLPTHINGERAPYEIHNALYSQFSIARFYGGCTAYGTRYVWVDSVEPMLVRADLFAARRKDARMRETIPRCARTKDLFEVTK